MSARWWRQRRKRAALRSLRTMLTRLPLEARVFALILMRGERP